MKKNQQLGLLFMTISAIGLAIATILMKLIPVSTDLTPGQVAVWRFAIAAPVIWFFTLSSKKKVSPEPKQTWRLVGLGVVFSAASLLALLSLGRLSTSLYAILVYIYPSLVVIYSLAARRPVSQLWWLGIPLTLFGLTLTIFDFSQSLQVDGLGVVLSILNGVVLAVYNILGERIFNQIPDRQVGTTWIFTGAMGVGLLLGFIFGFNTPDNLTGWLLLVSLGLFGTLIPILSLNYGIQLLGATQSSVIMTMQPVLAVILSTIIFSDVLSVQQWLGGLLVILAILLLQWAPKRTRAAARD
jgi:drug/metabolite transporter (DMT)-like permease